MTATQTLKRVFEIVHMDTGSIAILPNRSKCWTRAIDEQAYLQFFYSRWASIQRCDWWRVLSTGIWFRQPWWNFKTAAPVTQNKTNSLSWWWYRKTTTEHVHTMPNWRNRNYQSISKSSLKWFKQRPHNHWLGYWACESELQHRWHQQRIKKFDRWKIIRIYRCLDGSWRSWLSAFSQSILSRYLLLFCITLIQELVMRTPHSTEILQSLPWLAIFYGSIFIRHDCVAKHRSFQISKIQCSTSVAPL